jgi:hypothetical protein
MKTLASSSFITLAISPQERFDGRKDTKMLMTFLSQDLAGFVFTLGCSFVPMRGPEGPSLISR